MFFVFFLCVQNFILLVVHVLWIFYVFIWIVGMFINQILMSPFASLSLSFFKEILLASSSYFMNLCIFMNWLFVQIRSLWTLLPLLFHIFVLVKMLIQALSFMDLYLLFVAHFIIFCHINLLESSISLCRFLNLIGKIFFWIFH